MTLSQLRSCIGLLIDKNMHLYTTVSATLFCRTLCIACGRHNDSAVMNYFQISCTAGIQFYINQQIKTNYFTKHLQITCQFCKDSHVFIGPVCIQCFCQAKVCGRKERERVKPHNIGEYRWHYKLKIQHDVKNRLFCYGIFCIYILMRLVAPI